MIPYFKLSACLSGVHKITIWSSELVYATDFILGSLEGDFVHI